MQEKVRGPQDKDVKKQNWVNSVKEPQNTGPISRPTPKPVDEDLYKISPELLYVKSTKVTPHTHPFAFEEHNERADMKITMDSCKT